MNHAFICDAIRTSIGRYGSALKDVRANDLGAIPLRALMGRNKDVDWGAVQDVILGCANQAGEDNRNVARMSLLLSRLPLEIGGSTINRLCGSGMDTVGIAARAIKSGKADSAFSRNAANYDTTIGWRFVNALMETKYGVDSMPETGENVAADYKIKALQW